MPGIFPAQVLPWTMCVRCLKDITFDALIINTIVITKIISNSRTNNNYNIKD